MTSIQPQSRPAARSLGVAGQAPLAHPGGAGVAPGVVVEVELQRRGVARSVMLRHVRSSSPSSVRLAGSSRDVDGVAGVARRARAGRRRGWRRCVHSRALPAGPAAARERRATDQHTAGHERCTSAPQHVAQSLQRQNATRTSDRAVGVQRATGYNRWIALMFRGVVDGISDRTDSGHALRARPDRRGHRARRSPRGRAFRIVGAVDIDPAQGRAAISAKWRASGAALRVKVSDDRQESDQGGQAGRRRAVHQLVAEEGAAAVRRRS